jgi:excisionase family DNA binding protein
VDATTTVAHADVLLPETRATLATLERQAQAATTAEVIAVLGELERLKALLWHRLLGAVLMPAPDAGDDLRHLTPAQVAELLSLKEPYVHELCRTGRLPAIKRGKYWLISHAALRQHLAYPGGDVDAGGGSRLESLHPRGDTARGPRGRRRRSPAAR